MWKNTASFKLIKWCSSKAHNEIFYILQYLHKVTHNFRGMQ